MVIRGKRGVGGFHSMSAEEKRRIATMGGKAAHQNGHHGHEWTSEEAKEAGRKGGRVSRGGRARILNGQTEMGETGWVDGTEAND